LPTCFWISTIYGYPKTELTAKANFRRREYPVKKGNQMRLKRNGENIFGLEPTIENR